MFERFTDPARRVVVLAQEEARMLNHNYIGTEHILLGLIHESEGVAVKALESVGISWGAVIGEIEEFIGRGQQVPSGHIPFTPRTKKVLESSLREALQLSHNYIGTEHLLLALLREMAHGHGMGLGQGESVAGFVLGKLNIDPVCLRQVCLKLLKIEDDPAPMRKRKNPAELSSEEVNPTSSRFAGVSSNLNDEIAALRKRADAHFQSARELEQIAERLENISKSIQIAGEE
jgi:ATP-dependent Clp protease ATP-binding subunit ClpC